MAWRLARFLRIYLKVMPCGERHEASFHSVLLLTTQTVEIRQSSSALSVPSLRSTPIRRRSQLVTLGMASAGFSEGRENV
jgi:hypothetical protein